MAYNVFGGMSKLTLSIYRWHWQVLSLCAVLMSVGRDRFPEVFDCIVKVGSNNDCFFENDVFPTNKYVTSCADWLGNWL